MDRSCDGGTIQIQLNSTNGQHKVTNMKKLVSVLALGFAVSLSGCATNQTGYSKNVPIAYTTTESALEIIATESQKAMNAAQQLAKYQDSYNATLDYRQRQFESDQVMIDYIGKPNTVLNSIAIRYGYRYIELGNPQDLPTVNFTNYWTTPNNAVVNIDAKLGNQGSIAVDKKQKVITLIYPNAESVKTANQ